VEHKRVVEKRDQQFFDAFLIIVGIFVGMIAGIVLLGDLVGDGEAAQGAEHSAVEDRIAPIGRVAMIGDASLAAAPAPAAPAAAAPSQAPAGAASGAELYTQVCAVCHAPGLMGAPMLTDPASWEPRIAQGMDVLRDHVINGFQGQSGVMPPKGGRMDLSDEQVLAAMEYMLDNVDQ
jgi:cytochrome c5